MTIAQSLHSSFNRTNYSDLSEKYNAAYDWFQSFGFDIAATRLREYKSCIDELSEHFANETLDSAVFKKNFDQQVVSISEATEIIRIHKGLSKLYSSELKDKLKFVLSGKHGRPLPSDFDPGRDIAFELLMASQCQDAGFSIEIGKKADIVVLYKNIEFFVECKRLKSPKKVQKRIRESVKQLHKRFKSARNTHVARGIVALSITDLVNPKQGLLIGDDHKELRQKASRVVDSFIEQYRKYWQNIKDKRTIGAYIELSTPSVIESENLLTTCHQVGVNNSCEVNTTDYITLVEFSQKIAERWKH